jgi:hypothetical protein
MHHLLLDSAVHVASGQHSVLAETLNSVAFAATAGIIGRSVHVPGTCFEQRHTGWLS